MFPYYVLVYIYGLAELKRVKNFDRIHRFFADASLSFFSDAETNFKGSFRITNEVYKPAYAIPTSQEFKAKASQMEKVVRAGLVEPIIKNPFFTS